MLFESSTCLIFDSAVIFLNIFKVKFLPPYDHTDNEQTGEVGAGMECEGRGSICFGKHLKGGVNPFPFAAESFLIRKRFPFTAD